MDCRASLAMARRGWGEREFFAAFFQKSRFAPPDGLLG
jgi:hypothetical protein